MTGDVDRPAGQRGQERDVGRSLMRPTGRRCVVRRAGRDEHAPKVVVAEVELDLLVRPLDEERGVRVRDGAVALEREPGRDSDHQLLADADVVEPWVLWHLRTPDLGQPDGDTVV